MNLSYHVIIWIERSWKFHNFTKNAVIFMKILLGMTFSIFSKYTRCHVCCCYFHCLIDYSKLCMLPNVELDSIRIAILRTLYTWRSVHFALGSLLTPAFNNTFIHCCNVVEVIYVDRSLSVHFDKNRFLNWFGILKLIWNRTFGKNGSQPHGCEMLTRIPGIQFVCVNATGPESCSAYMSSCQRQTPMTRWYL